MTLLEVREVTVRVQGIKAVDGVSLSVEPGQRVGIIGESGSGKTLTALSIMGLLPQGLHAEGSISLGGIELSDLSEGAMCRVRGDELAMIFQDPMSSLNPVMKVGRQVAEVFRVHRGQKYRECKDEISGLFSKVGLGNVDNLLSRYPHQLSGGQRQRVMLAIALACQPELLIADEPTTALDVTVQKRVLELIDNLVREEDLALLLISHDLPVVARLCDRVVVMYGGRVMEDGSTRSVLGAPRHPYTQALLRAVPTRRETRATAATLPTIPGHVPGLGRFPSGCVFRDRCPYAEEKCRSDPPMFPGESSSRCWFPLDEAGQPTGKTATRA